MASPCGVMERGGEVALPVGGALGHTATPPRAGPALSHSSLGFPLGSPYKI